MGALAGTAPATAQVLLTQEEALRLAFPPPLVVTRETAYVDAEQLAAVRSRAGEGVAVEASVLSYYRATHAGRPVGVAYFDAHRVRTLGEVLMIIVDTLDRVTRVEVLRFAEPLDYVAPEGWLRLLQGRALTPDLRPRGSLPNITGATLTAEAVVGAVRRVLAYHAEIAPFRRRAP